MTLVCDPGFVGRVGQFRSRRRSAKKAIESFQRCGISMLTRCPSARRRSLKAIALPLAFLSLSSYGIGYYVVRIIYLELATIDLLEASLHDGSRSLITQTHNMRHGHDARRKTRGNDDRRASRRPRRSDKKGHGGAETAAPPPLGRKNPTR